MDLSVLTSRPGDDLVLIPLKQDFGVICERGATDRGVGVSGGITEVTKHEVVREEFNKSSGILGDAVW